MENENDKKIRSRNWFITINPNAECYKKVEEIIKSYKYTHYAYIYHDADEDNKNDKHIHLIIELANPRSFEAIQNKFNGAHIQIAKFKFQCYKYLIHLESDNKKKYEIANVICDNIDYYKECIKSDEFEKLDTNAMLTDIKNGTNTITEFVIKYGIYQVSKFTFLVNNLIKENDYITRIEYLEKEIEDLKKEIAKLNENNEDLFKIIDDNNILPF